MLLLRRPEFTCFHKFIRLFCVSPPLRPRCSLLAVPSVVRISMLQYPPRPGRKKPAPSAHAAHLEQFEYDPHEQVLYSQDDSSSGPDAASTSSSSREFTTTAQSSVVLPPAPPQPPQYVGSEPRSLPQHVSDQIAAVLASSHPKRPTSASSLSRRQVAADIENRLQPAQDGPPLHSTQPSTFRRQKELHAPFGSSAPRMLIDVSRGLCCCSRVTLR